MAKKIKGYSFKKGLSKAGNGIALFGIPMFVMYLTQFNADLVNAPISQVVASFIEHNIGTLSLGGALVLAQNYIKNRNK